MDRSDEDKTMDFTARDGRPADSQPNVVNNSDNSVVDNNNNNNKNNNNNNNNNLQNAIMGRPRRVSEGNHRAVCGQPNAVNNSGNFDVNNNRTSENANQAIPRDVLLRNRYRELLKSVEDEEKKPKKRPRCPNVGSHVVDHYFEKISCRASFDASRYTREPSYGPSDEEMRYTVDTEESESDEE